MRGLYYFFLICHYIGTCVQLYYIFNPNPFKVDVTLITFSLFVHYFVSIYTSLRIIKSFEDLNINALWKLFIVIYWFFTMIFVIVYYNYFKNHLRVSNESEEQSNVQNDNDELWEQRINAIMNPEQIYRNTIDMYNREFIRRGIERLNIDTGQIITSKSILEEDIEQCPICLNNNIDIELTCEHQFCNNCIESWKRERRRQYPNSPVKCPLCIQNIDRNHTIVNVVNSVDTPPPHLVNSSSQTSLSSLDSKMTVLSSNNSSSDSCQIMSVDTENYDGSDDASSV